MATLREKAMGVLGSRFLQMEREGWKPRRWPKGQRWIDSAALGPLPGGKVQQLQEAGVDLIRKNPYILVIVGALVGIGYFLGKRSS